MSVSKVLVADDSPVVLHMIESMLSAAGLAVVTARDGMEALEKAFSEPVCLVILDVSMPRLNGYQACRLLKNEPSTRDLPVVILTSRDQAGDRFWGLETGADYYLTKDAEPRRILELVRNILASEPAARREPPATQPKSVDLLSRVNELLDRKLYEATILSEIGRVARDLTQLDQTFTSVMALVGRVADFSVGGIAFVDEDELELMLVVQRPASAAVIEEVKHKLLEAVTSQLKGASVARVHTRVLQPGTPSGPEETKLAGFHSVPVTTGGRLIGMLALAGRALARLSPESDALLEKVANQALIVTENCRLFDRVRTLSIRDSLTDLFNHRHSMELLGIEYQRVTRYEGQMGVLMVDVDLFKRVNDELGHQAGDSVLREVARRLREGLRSVDTLGRYGGEEFIAILPHTSLAEARQTAERLRKAVAARPVRIAQQERPVTISVGVATYPTAGVDSPAELVRRADAALYRAKQAGRNQVAS